MGWIDALLIPAIKSLVSIVVLLVGFAYMTLIERKLVGRFTVRYGPNRAGPFGIVQPIADAFKAIFKEELIPTYVDKLVYVLAPGIAVASSLIAFAVLPMGKPFVAWGHTITLSIGNINVGLLFILAIAVMGIYGLFLGGWSSNNNFSMMGALRTTAQVITNELPLGLALVGLVLVAGSLNINAIVDAQKTLPLIILQPLGFIIFVICGMSEVNRSPFDLPETENELVAGYSTEYGGIKFAIFYMAEYLNMIVLAITIATLYLGGWRGPGAELSPLIGLFWVVVKTFIMLFIFVWVRSSLPRVRYDKWMKFSWTFIVPLAVLNLIVTAIVVVLVA